MKKNFFTVAKRLLTRLCLVSSACLLTLAVDAQQERSSAVVAAEQYLGERGEVILRFVRPAGYSIDYLTQLLSIHRVDGDTVIAYANEAAFGKFLTLQIPFEVLTPPSLKKGHLIENRQEYDDWRNHYPAYDEYISLMEGFAADYPGLCRLTQFGTSVMGRKLLALKISDNPDADENEPSVMYSSSMHGNELLGYVLMLRLIDHLLANYNASDDIRQLVDQLEIWINPLANPDGCFFKSDSSVEDATRFNANHVDLNRDFPDIRNYTLDDEIREPETLAMMGLMKSIRLVLAANFHGGAEVVNYPWDTWFTRHADDAWYRYISRAYADTVHAHAPAGYMTFLDDGITNGNEWYSVYGGRQDYANFFLYAREVTIELSDEYIPAESSLEDYWNYNRKSLLQYIGQSLTGITGTVTDSVTGQPLEARIRIENHDFDNSWVYSSADDGNYYRLTTSGDYLLRVSSHDYTTKRQQVHVSDGALTEFNVALAPQLKALYPNPFINTLNFYMSETGLDLVLEFFDLTGRKVLHISQPVVYKGVQTIEVRDLAAGMYAVRIKYGDSAWKQIVIRQVSLGNE